MDAPLESTQSRLDHEELKRRPELLVELTGTQKFSFDLDDLADIQLSALRMRFANLVEKVPVLTRFAETQGVTEIRSIEDGALLMLPHTMYKSYPLSAIENARFDRMTRWLDTLTALDLSVVDSSACQDIDDWVDVLDASTEIRVRHSSGTTGKLSFTPFTESYTSAMGFKRYFEGFGDEPDAQIDGVGKLPLITFGYRRGAMGTARMIDALQHYFYGDDPSLLVTTNPNRMSADMLSLGGRLESAQQRGELGKLNLSPRLLARREAFIQEQAQLPRIMDEFFETITSRFRGQRVILNGVTPLVVETAMAGVARGLENLFAPDSMIFLAGGAKGRTLPDDYPQIFERFSGAPFPRTGYGMSEAASAITRMCPSGHFHIPPNIIPYLLEPATGAILPRTGVQTGRYGIIDLATQSRWGGFLTGDEITLNFGDKEPCGCGRRGVFIQGNIRRYSESEGGDDKITCAGTPGVHDMALDFVAGAVG